MTVEDFLMSNPTEQCPTQHDYTSGSVTRMTHKKPHLPEKTCIVCQKPFKWRKKWEKVWDQVKYCSDKCRKAKSKE